MGEHCPKPAGLDVHPGLHQPRCQICYLHLLNFITSVVAQYPNLWQSLCKASLPLRESIVSLNLVNKVHFTGFPCPGLVRILKRTGLILNCGEHHYWLAMRRYYPIHSNSLSLTSQSVAHSSHCVHWAVCWTFHPKGYCTERLYQKLCWNRKSNPLPPLCG